MNNTYDSSTQIYSTNDSIYKSTWKNIYINPFGKSSENAVMTWQPTSTTDTGESYISGTLSLVYTGVKLTMSTTLYRSLSIGVVAATGNFTGTLGYNNSTSTFTGSRGQNDVIVNY